ncbi:fibrinogen-like protein A isoform X2 [Crassostrea virginica]
MDCGEKPLPRHAEVIYYVDSKIGSQVQFQCKNYTTTPNRTGVAECSSSGGWIWTQSIQCTVPQDCLELYEKYNISVSGPYYISPDNNTIARVFCDMKTSGGGWTVIQRRNSSNVNFTRNWANYTNGFGEVTGNYWIGNRILHALTSSNNIIMFRLRHINGSTYNASYSNFRVLDEAKKFKMTYDHYINGTAGDALGNANQHSAKKMSFSTIDRDNDKCDKSCAAQMKGGWWYNNCSTSNLNGVYCLNGTNNSYCMTWSTNHNEMTWSTSPHLLRLYNETMISIRRTPNQQTTTSKAPTTTKTTTTTPQ